MRPGEQNRHPSALTFDQIEAHQFAARNGERFVEQFLAESRRVTMNADVRADGALPGGFPFWKNDSTGMRAENRVAGDQPGHTLLQCVR